MAGEPTVQFLGAAGGVTGSCYLVNYRGRNILVDAGMFQGSSAEAARNSDALPVDPTKIDAVVLTHGHLDHCGRLPFLVKKGFTGPIYATRWSAEIAAIIMRDSGRIQERNVRSQLRRVHVSSNAVGSAAITPLYTERDAKAAVQRLRAVEIDTDFEIAPGITAHMRNAGHILGSASVELGFDDGHTLLFSGDLGRDLHPLLLPPADPPRGVDAVLIESTYGDRSHPDQGTSMDGLADVVKRTQARGGVTVIPAFSVDRTEVLLAEIGRLMVEGKMPRVPVYLAGNMSVAVLGVYRRALAAGDPEYRPELFGTDPFDPVGVLHLVHTREGYDKLDQVKSGIIIASAGMVKGLSEHLVEMRVGDSRNSVLLSGYQAAGSQGRRLESGASTLRIRGRQVDIRAEVRQIGALSAHADGPGLIAWLRKADAAMTYAVHGEPHKAGALVKAIRSQLHRRAEVAEDHQTVTISGPQASEQTIAA